MTIGFSLPALHKYGQGNRYINQPLDGCSNSFCHFIDRFSMYNMNDPVSILTLVEWLGLGFISILMISFYFAWKMNKEIRDVIKYE